MIELLRAIMILIGLASLGLNIFFIIYAIKILPKLDKYLTRELTQEETIYKYKNENLQ